MVNNDGVGSYNLSIKIIDLIMILKD